ncbi:MAG TPA: CPBP family intramembrane glutamic endopeptidase [Terriglobales bacterium]
MRNPWREVGLGGLNLLLVILTIAGIQPILHKFHASQIVGVAVIALLVLLIYLVASKWIERRAPDELKANRALPEGLAGLLLGLALFSAVMAILWTLGVYHPGGRGTTHGLAIGLVLALSAGVMEEILFRGLLFRLSAKILGTWGALLLTAAFFGAAHAFNPGATISSSLAIALEAGILLGAAYAATTRLWLPIGLHIAWNFTEGPLFGMAVSGGNMGGASLLRGSLSGPRILTGGEFGPEASIVAVLVCLAAALYFILRIVKLHRVELPVWSRPKPRTDA